MSYELNVNKNQEYIHLTYSGIVSLAERQAAKKEVITNCFDNNFYRALVDLRKSDIQMSESDTIKFAASFKDTKLPENYRLACILETSSHSENIVEIIITLDGVNIKYFINFEEAENWLTSI